MGSSSRRRLLAGLSIAIVGSACASLMGVEEASLRDSSSPDGGATPSAPSAPTGEVPAACAGEGCPCNDDSECPNDPYRKCVANECTECSTESDDCPTGRYCQAGPDGNRCVLGCKSDGDCKILSPSSAPKCSPSRHQCVECIDDADCDPSSNKKCSPSGTCADRCTADGGSCPNPNETCCSGFCIDVSSDPFNCNGCGNSCRGASPLCCAGACKDSASDPSACGSCETTCKVAAGTPICAEGRCLPANCNDVLAADPQARSDVYLVDPDGTGPQAPFSVYCDMGIHGGGWTLVGRELREHTGNLRFFGYDSGNATALAKGSESGIIGTRFLGRYQEVLIVWGDGLTKYIRFSKPNGFDMFENRVNKGVRIDNVQTSERTLEEWLRRGGGAELCVAARHDDIRPGDTSWAIKPRNDNHDTCGCNDKNWVGQGAYYGGTLPPHHDPTCDGWGGGWAGVKASGEQKGGIVPSYETRIYIR